MKILIIGNLGYVGPVLVDYLKIKDPNNILYGLDTGFFEGSYLNPYETGLHKVDCQIYSDVDHISDDLLASFECIVYLAAVSNDPMGNVYEKATNRINCEAAIKCASRAKSLGVKSFIFASSCSVYGAGSDSPRSEEDAVNPLTAYARSKVNCEMALEKLAESGFYVTCLRFATACGYSPRLRLDLVLNDFVVSGLLNKKIEILSDGMPWRPLISVDDMSKAIGWAAQRYLTITDTYLKINVGFDNWNFRVIDLAQAVKMQLPDTEIVVNPQAVPDKRSYQVDFSKYEKYAPENRIDYTIDRVISVMITRIKDANFTIGNFRNSHLIRLNTLNYLKDRQKITSDLFWR